MESFDNLSKESTMKNITWFDGKNAHGKFILEISFRNGGTGYLKNESRERINDHIRILFDCPDIVGMVVYDPAGNKIDSKTKSKNAA